VLKNINIIKTNKLTKHQLNKINIEIARADALMKYAFNNIGFAHDIKEIADDCRNFDEFIHTLAYRSKYFFNQCIKTNKQNLEHACKFNNYSLQKTIDEFNALYD
jgi:enoyl-[acyl-carrier-protein] reductase (NADH)